MRHPKCQCQGESCTCPPYLPIKYSVGSVNIATRKVPRRTFLDKMTLNQFESRTFKISYIFGEHMLDSRFSKMDEWELLIMVTKICDKRYGYAK